MRVACRMLGKEAVKLGSSIAKAQLCTCVAPRPPSCVVHPHPGCALLVPLCMALRPPSTTSRASWTVWAARSARCGPSCRSVGRARLQLNRAAGERRGGGVEAGTGGGSTKIPRGKHLTHPITPLPRAPTLPAAAAGHRHLPQNPVLSRELRQRGGKRPGRHTRPTRCAASLRGMAAVGWQGAGRVYLSCCFPMPRFL